MKYLKPFAVITLMVGLITPGFSMTTSVVESQPNVIFLIGDGMGLAAISATSMTERPLELEQFPFVGLAKTSCSDAPVTDSAAAATALATGVKTKTYAVGVDPEGKPVESVLIEAQKRGQAVGFVVTSAVTHATPAGFYAHQPNRGMGEEIAGDLVAAKLDLFIGGGRKHFDKRKDEKDLTKALVNDGYKVAFTLDEVLSVQGGKLAALLAEDWVPAPKETNAEGVETGRGAMLPQAVERAIQILKQNPKGFFLMVEGSRIDYSAHKNDAAGVIAEMLDFNETVKKALDFAKADGNTLVVVTADHETGGITLPKGGEKGVQITFSTKGHTGIMVPVFAYGPGAEKFTGVYENSDIPKKIRELFTVKP